MRLTIIAVFLSQLYLYYNGIDFVFHCGMFPKVEFRNANQTGIMIQQKNIRHLRIIQKICALGSPGSIKMLMKLHTRKIWHREWKTNQSFATRF
jgi:hypothetical protein